MPALSEPLSYQAHELLLALVGGAHVLEQSGELGASVRRQQKRVPRLAQELDEVAVVARADVRQTRVGGVGVSGHGGLQQGFERRPLIAEGFGRPPLGVRRRQARRRHGAAPQNVRQHGGALHVLHQQRHHVRELRLAQRVAQRTRPVDVVDGRMGVL